MPAIASVSVSTQARPPFDIFVRSGSTPNYSGTPIPDGQEFALMTADFVVTSSVLDVPSYFPTIAPSIFTSGIGIARFSAVWAEDTLGGTAAANRVGGFNSLNATAPNTGTITVGVPEPTAFGLLLGIVGLAGLRRPGICGR